MLRNARGVSRRNLRAPGTVPSAVLIPTQDAGLFLLKPAEFKAALQLKSGAFLPHVSPTRALAEGKYSYLCYALCLGSWTTTPELRLCTLVQTFLNAAVVQVLWVLRASVNPLRAVAGPMVRCPAFPSEAVLEGSDPKRSRPRLAENTPRRFYRRTPSGLA